MKYTLTINQKQAIELGVTNVNQLLILDIISVAPTWTKPEIIDNEVYFWVSRTKIVDELPVLNLKPDTVYRHLKQLAEDGLIDHVKQGKKDCVRLTEKGKLLFINPMSEINPSHYVGNKSEKPMSEINPTDKNTSILLQDKEWLDLEAWEFWEQHRKEKKIKLTSQSIKLQLKLLEEHKQHQVEIIHYSVRNNYQGLFVPRHLKEQTYKQNKPNRTVGKYAI